MASHGKPRSFPCPPVPRHVVLRPAVAALSAIFGSCLALAPGVTLGQSTVPEKTLPEVKVQGEAERADGPVPGYRATRSSTFTRTDTPLREVPASISVVPAQVMKDAGMQSMGDVFRYVPGAAAHQGEGNRDQVVLRGISTSADFFVDGVRDDAQVFRDLYNLERVEVLKGPGGMAFGRGGAGGVVNRVTKRPVFDRVGEASLTLGSWDQRRGTVDVGNRLGDSVAWRLNAMAEKSDSFRDGAGLERYALNPTATLSIGAQTLLTVGYEHLWDYRTADRGIPSRNGAPFETSPSTFFGNAGQSNARSVVDGAYATLEHDFGGGMQLRNTFRVTHYDKYYQNVYPGSAVDAAGNLTLNAYNNASQRTNVFNQTDFTRKLSAGGFEHTLLVGAELGHQDSASKRNTGFFGAATGITVPASNPFAVATRFAAAGTDADNQVKSDLAAVYVQDQVALSRQWKLLAGLRYDRFTVNFDDRRTTTPAVDLSRTDTAFSPRLGLIWTPDARSTYYLSYSESFLPSGEQLGLATTTADLAPETAKNYEAGARWDLRPALTLSTALFRTDRDDVRVADPARPGFFIGTGQQRTEGVEVGLQGDVTPVWQVYAGYAHLDGRVTRALNTGTAATAATTVPAGARLGLVPQNAFSAWNRFNLGGGWGAGLGIIHQSSAFASVSNTVTLPAFTRTDGALYYAINAKTRVSLNMENLTNRKYYPAVDGDNNISPGAPRNAKVTLSLAF
jgi:catecholate siderophore receptor